MYQKPVLLVVNTINLKNYLYVDGYMNDGGVNVQMSTPIEATTTRALKSGSSLEPAVGNTIIRSNGQPAECRMDNAKKAENVSVFRQ